LGFNEADTHKSSSILIYSHSEQNIYTQEDCHEAVVIAREIKRERFKLMIENVNEIMKRELMN
jgi:hypothetical protein